MHGQTFYFSVHIYVMQEYFIFIFQCNAENKYAKGKCMHDKLDA